MGSVPVLGPVPGSALRPRVCRGTARWGPRGRSRGPGLAPEGKERASPTKELAGTVPRNGPCDGGCLQQHTLALPCGVSARVVRRCRRRGLRWRGVRGGMGPTVSCPRSLRSSECRSRPVYFPPQRVVYNCAGIITILMSPPVFVLQVNHSEFGGFPSQSRPPRARVL